MYLRLSLCLALTASAALAQQTIVYHNTKAPTSTNAFPFGSEGIRYQSIVPGSTFSNKLAVIKDIFVFGSGDLNIVYEDIEIRMGITTATTMTTNWSTNNPKPTTVYRGPMQIQFKKASWTGIGLPNSYLFLPTSNSDNLCVEVIVWSAKTMPTSSTASNFYYPGATSVPRAFLYQWTSKQTSAPLTGTSSGCAMGFLLNNGNFVTAGVGCKSSASSELRINSSTYPQPGSALDVTLTGGAASSVSFLALGVKFTPFEMTPMSAPGCHVWFAPLLYVGTLSDNSGAAAFKPTIPKTSTAGTAYAQWYQFDAKANTAGLTTSNFATIILGN